MKIAPDFYLQKNPSLVARKLLGKKIFTHIDHALCSGIIVETEAYLGVQDRASHAYGNRRTKRTEIMYAPGGVIYMYLCYGLHHLLNVVSNEKDIPHAILIRALQPIDGIHIMKKRRKMQNEINLCNGPGKLSRALGLTVSDDGESLSGDRIWIEEGIKIPNKEIISSPRIGVDYAGEDAQRPYRFYIKSSKYISGK